MDSGAVSSVPIKAAQRPFKSSNETVKKLHKPSKTGPANCIAYHSTAKLYSVPLPSIFETTVCSFGRYYKVWLQRFTSPYMTPRSTIVRNGSWQHLWPLAQAILLACTDASIYSGPFHLPLHVLLFQGHVFMHSRLSMRQSGKTTQRAHGVDC